MLLAATQVASGSSGSLPSLARFFLPRKDLQVPIGKAVVHMGFWRGALLEKRTVESESSRAFLRGHKDLLYQELIEERMNEK